MRVDFTAIISIVGMTLSFLSATVLLAYHRRKSSPQHLLAAYFYVVAYVLLVIFLIVTGLIEKVPHVFRTGVLVAYLFPQLAYLYVRQNVRPGLRALDALHFLPAFFYLIDFLPFYLLPAEHKISVIQQVTGENIENLMAHEEGWLTPPWFHLAFRTALALVYWILSVRLLWNLKSLNSQFHADNGPVVKWLWVFVTFQFFIYAPYLTLALAGVPQYTFYTTTVPFTIIVTVVCIALFFRPTIFYGFSGALIQSEPAAPNSSPDRPAAPSQKVSRRHLEYLRESDIQLIRQSVAKFLVATQPYLVPGYSINDFGKDLGMPVKKLSAYINRAEDTNFRDFLNRHRIAYCMEQLAEGAWRNLTLEAIAQQCGFSNRNSFTSAFKKFGGTNPSEFLQRVRDGESVEL